MSITYNRDGKLRSSYSTINLKYDPLGNRIWRKAGSTERKYIVDIVGDLPVVLLEINPGPTDDTIANTYIYANSQILAQYAGDHTASKYFYMHDRLGSVRLVIDTAGAVQKLYTYDAFGNTLEQEGSLANPFRFTGQWHDWLTDL